MTARRLTAVDAQAYWMAASVPSDQYLLYAFGDRTTDLDDTLAAIRARARACIDLGVRIRESGFWTYPVWARRDVGLEQIVVHDIDDATWTGCLNAVAAMVDDPLDAAELAWRLHVFPDIEGLPATRAATVAVLQISHALADGVRASELAAYLFGRDTELTPVAATRSSAVLLPALAFRAARTHRRMTRDAEAGLVPPQVFSRPALRSNARPQGTRYLRTVFCERGEIRGPTVTVGALAAVSVALAGHLRELGDDPSQLGAEVPMAKAAPRRSSNHYGNVGVGLYPDQEQGRRIGSIAADLAARRRRAAHPAMAAEGVAFAAVPAPVLRWGVGQFDPAVRSDTVIGNTVVSSVNRGPKDLRFGDASVLLTAGFAGLSPMMGVTHGVHGVGDTVAVSVYAAESAIGGNGGIDAYVERLERALHTGEG